ncbi:hypothetical protein GF359_09835 [candidate division WOR-3 bacterium]|uniref:Uncharacterized protein n=1 Tax=candidate division WOR-3 bacterium TaxID=2052148 RepID=A0A9D5KCE1_UNCW3|nr:hypothetical protein [candidate division WOR-3 bacterium]MBD3365500.1 hypothetical protein [candidate division WOR-3 bacterium]
MSVFLAGCLLVFGVYEMPDVDLYQAEGVAVDSLWINLPHTQEVAEHITLRTGKGEDPIVRSGAFFRYALDLYQLKLDKSCIIPNLKALRNELLLIGDQGKMKVDVRIGTTQEIETAIKQGVDADSVLAMFARLDTEIKTLTGEVIPADPDSYGNGADAFEMGKWIAAMGVRLAIYPGCDDEKGKPYVLSHISTLIETIEKEDSDNWTGVVVSMKDDISDYHRSRMLEFISGLPYSQPVSEDDIKVLLGEIKTTYSVFNLEFILCA